MIEVVSLKGLLSGPRYVGGAWLNTRSNWTREDSIGLQILCRNDIDVEQAADSLGRAPTALAHRAIKTGLMVPTSWRSLVRPRSGGRSLLLEYPFIVNVRGEHAELLEVNALVPRYLGSHARGDICQEIMLALWQKEFSLDDLKSDKKILRRFLRGFRQTNYEGSGYALSLDVPMKDGRSWYDVLPDPATKEFN